MRWADNIKKYAGSRWTKIATNMEEWKRVDDAYIQTWTENFITLFIKMFF